MPSELDLNQLVKKGTVELGPEEHPEDRASRLRREERREAEEKEARRRATRVESGRAPTRSATSISLPITSTGSLLMCMSRRTSGYCAWKAPSSGEIHAMPME